MVAFISLVIALGVVFGTSFFHGDQVRTKADVRHTHYGFPIAWISQDQSALVQAPDRPTSITFGSPWHNPTNANVADLVADIAIIAAAPITLYWTAAGSARLLRRPRHPHHALADAVA